MKIEFSLFDPKFLEEVSKMKERNLTVELLKKLIAEQVSIYRRTNLVKSEKFSEIIQNAMNRYLNGMLTNEQVIEGLLKLAKDIAAAAAEGDKLGFLYFYKKHSITQTVEPKISDRFKRNRQTIEAKYAAISKFMETGL